MLDIPIDLPPMVDLTPGLLDTCVLYASKKFEVNTLVIRSIVEVEGGKIGTVSKNSNGTYDLGVMQINTIHLKDIARKYPGVGWQELAYKPCINIAVATWILKKRISETDDYWRGVGNYHSKTRKYHDIYLSKIVKVYRRIRAQAIFQNKVTR